MLFCVLVTRIEAGGATFLIDYKFHTRLNRWNKETAPSLDALRTALTGEGFATTEWTDNPGTVYPLHSHEYPEVRWVIRGQLRIGLPESGEEFVLKAGDRLDLPSDAPHWIDVYGASPVVYLIGTRLRANGHHNGKRQATII